VDRLLVERAYVLGRRNRALGFRVQSPSAVERRAEFTRATLLDAAESLVELPRALPSVYHERALVGRRCQRATISRGPPPVVQAGPWDGSGKLILVRLFSALGSLLFRAQIAATLVSLSIIGVLAIASLWR